jgi:hypothetical protein
LRVAIINSRPLTRKDRTLQFPLEKQSLAESLGIEGAAWIIVARILYARSPEAEDVTLVAPSEDASEDELRAALAELHAGGWLAEWAIKHVGKFYTFTPLAAERLNVVPMYPEQEGSRVEPQWGHAGIEPGGYFDTPHGYDGRLGDPREQIGRYQDEPEFYQAELDWDWMTRSLTRMERIIRARPAPGPSPEDLVIDPVTGEPMRLFAGDGSGGVTVSRDPRMKATRTNRRVG